MMFNQADSVSYNTFSPQLDYRYVAYPLLLLANAALIACLVVPGLPQVLLGFSSEAIALAHFFRVGYKTSSCT